MTSEGSITRYAVLRDGQRWEEVRLSGLEAEPDGVLRLARVPGTRPGEELDLPGPYASDPSGVAVGSCGDLFVADTVRHRVIWRDGICGTRMVLPSHRGASNALGHFDEPRALLLGAAGLYVADSGNARIQIFRLPTLEPRAVWTGGLDSPTGLAADGAGRVYVLDRGLKTVLRFSAWGQRDDTFNAAVATQLVGASPKFVAVDFDGTLYLSDDAAGTLLRFDKHGGKLPDLPLLGAPAGFAPGALAAHAQRLYVADAASGGIWIFDIAAGHFIGAVAGYRGPVTAMTFDSHGNLYVKPGLDETVHLLAANLGCVHLGELVSGPLDAGDASGWVRAFAEAEQPARTSVALRTFVAENPASAPAASDWSDPLSPDVLLPRFLVSSFNEPQPRRYLWLRVRLSSEEGRATPRLLQVQAETPGEEFIDSLPAIYRQKDHREIRAQKEPQDIGFLRRWLTLFHGELTGLETKLEEMPRRFNAATAPADGLAWLASWFAFEPPRGLSISALRELLPRVPALHRRRGTRFGVREFVELYTGVRPLLVESFRERRIWLLGESSLLGWDTALAPLAPHGMVVPDRTSPRGCCWLLTAGDLGNLTKLVKKPEDSPDPMTKFLWARFTEETQKVLRKSSTPEEQKRVLLRELNSLIEGESIFEAKRFAAVQLSAETAALNAQNPRGDDLIRLNRRLLEDAFPLEIARSRCPPDWHSRESAGSLVVGAAVVGESGPLAAEDFGEPLFGETAHHFSVWIPGGEMRDAARRRALARILDAEKPAHTDYDLCIVEPRMRVGLQSSIGVDSYVAGAPAPMALTGSVLGLNSYLGEEPGERGASRVGQRALLGSEIVLE